MNVFGLMVSVKRKFDS